MAASVPNITISVTSSGEASLVSANEISICHVVPNSTDAAYIDCRSRASILRAAEILTGKYSSLDKEVFIMSDVKGYTGNFWVRSQEISDAYGLAWHIVFIERVACSANFFLDTATKACQPCVNNEVSEDGNNEAICSGCIKNYYRKTRYDAYTKKMMPVDRCRLCPRGGTCLGGTKPPYAQRGYYQVCRKACQSILFPSFDRITHRYPFLSLVRL